MPRTVLSTARAWWLVAATLVIAWLTHYVVVIQHEYAHSIMAWLTGIKDNPIRIDWGGTGIHNVVTLGNIDEDVDYDQALAAGHTTAAALTAMAGVVIGNGVFYLDARQLLRRPAVAGRPWFLYFLFWYIVHSVGNFYDYVPLRTFAAGGDVNSFALATGWSRWWIYGVAGYLTLWAIVDLYQKAMPRTLGATGFERLRPARAIVLVLSTLALFALYALPALEQADPVSAFMGRTSLIIIPAVLIATWRRNVVSELPLPPGRQTREQRAPAQNASADVGHELTRDDRERSQALTGVADGRAWQELLSTSPQPVTVEGCVRDSSRGAVVTGSAQRRGCPGGPAGSGRRPAGSP